MDTGEVKIGKTGNGIPKMSYTQKVADFNTFIKSPEKFIKGMSVKTTDKVSAKTGDKDYKQLLGKVKMIGEKEHYTNEQIEEYYQYIKLCANLKMEEK